MNPLARKIVEALSDRDATAKSPEDRAQLVSAILDEPVVGPRERVERKLVCDGCPALKTEYWKDFEENDQTDSGTSAYCTAANKSINAYWRSNDVTPSWCPAKRPNAPAVDREIEQALSRALETSMQQTLRAPIPQCGEFGAIAQDLSFVHEKLFSPDAKAKAAEVQAHRSAHSLLVTETLDALGAGLKGISDLYRDQQRRDAEAPVIGQLLIERVPDAQQN